MRLPAGFTQRTGLQRHPRQLNAKARPLPRAALDADGAAVRLDDLAHDPQPQSEPTIVIDRNQALEFLENLGLLLGGNADTVIHDLDDSGRFRAERDYFDRLARA